MIQAQTRASRLRRCYPGSDKQEMQMNKFESITKPKMWLAALLLSAVMAGCSGGGSDPSVGGTAGLVPTVTTVAPLPNAIDVPINIKVITASFTEAMDPVTLTPANFTLTCSAGAPITGTVTYLAANSLAMLTLPAAIHLPANTLCTATVSTGAKGTAGVPLASNFVWVFTTGATLDTTAPVVTGTINANGATNVPINTKVAATFSEWMDPLTITTATFTLRQGATPIPGTVTYTGASAIFTPASHLAANTTYTATITTGAKSAEGNALASDFAWSWATTADAGADTIPPTVTGTIHTNGATNVPVNTKVGATFSEGMNPLTITSATFTLKETVSGTAVQGVVSYSGVSAVFIPLSNLAPGTRYTVTVKGGASGAKSLEGNALASDFVISWTTSTAPDTTAPTVTGTIHTNGATNIPVNSKVGATFSEGMDPLTITSVTFTLKETVTGATVPGIVSYSGVNAIFIPLNNLAANTNYTVSIKGGPGGVTDLAGNPLASNFALSWTTTAAANTTAPTVTGTLHANGATNVPINTRVGAAFSKWMDPLTITNVTFTLKETVTGTEVPGIVSYSGVSAVFIPLSNLSPNTRYTVTVKGGASGAKSLEGIALASDFVISWTTAAVANTTAPAIAWTTHANGATNVAINTKVGVAFSTWMDPLTITSTNFTLKETATGAAVLGIVGYSGVNAEFVKLNYLIGPFSPDAENFSPNTSYTATIKGGDDGARDLAGNPLASDYVWSWTTGAAPDTASPAVILAAPLANARGVALNSTVSTTFSEAMDPLTITTANFILLDGVTPIAGTVTYDMQNSIATFTPINPLALNGTYTVEISGVTDLAGNELASGLVPIPWSFTTAAAP